VRLVLASTSPQRRAILEQLRIPFEAAAPAYREGALADASPAELVRAHAGGKARSVHSDGQVTLGVDTAVVLGDRVYGKPADAADAERMLRDLSGVAHLVLSGVCLIGPGFEVVEDGTTTVRFRALGDHDVAVYLESGEWRGRAGGYAIQGLGGRLVAGIEGDYLNVVGLPGALLVTLLERVAPKLLAAQVANPLARIRDAQVP
jgi:septum formation protein